MKYNHEINLNNYSPKQISLSINAEHLRKLHREYSWRQISDMYQRSERTVYRWLKPIIRPKQKEGRKFKVDEKIQKLLLDYAKKNNTSTQQSMASYVFQETDVFISQQTVSRILRKHNITYKTLTYHYEQMPTVEEIKNFVDVINDLQDNQLLALDECGFHLKEDPRRGYSLRGTRAISKRPSGKGEHYTLLLCISDLEKDGVVHYQLVKDGADTKAFHDFLKGVDLPTNEKYYLLLDNARIHHAKKKCRDLGLLPIKELLISKNIQPNFLPPYTPQLNPTELCFNFIRQYIEKNRPRNFEQLKSFIDKAVEDLNKKDLTTYFQHCFDYFSFENTDISCG